MNLKFIKKLMQKIANDNTINFIKHSFVVLSLFFLSSCTTQKERKPNVIVIMTDDQGWGDLSYQGNQDLNTPNIDRIAKEGARFENFYVSPVCSPTRAEFLTGRYHFRSGVYSTSSGGERLNLGEETIAEVFKQAGYQTALYGKWHSGMQHPYHPNTRGFDDFYGFCSGHWGNYFGPILEHNGSIVKGNGFIVDDLTEHTTNFIQDNKQQPFFVYLSLNTPHSPMQVPDDYWDRFKEKPLVSNLGVKNPLHTRAALAMCENIDDNVGRILKVLEAHDLSENTIIVYLSDNGPNGRRWNAGMKGTKGTTDEGGTRSPLLIQWKNTIVPGSIKQLMGAVDLLPTLSALAGIDHDHPKPLDGINFKTTLLAQNTPLKERTLYHYWRGATSLRNQKFRLDKDNNLFDIEKDRKQTQMVDDDYPIEYASLKELKQTFIDTTAFPTKVTDNRPFPLGHADAPWTQLPARDALLSGNVQRSNRYPNSSFVTNWTAVDDRISWDVEVLNSGLYEAVLYYTCAAENLGSRFRLELGKNKLEATLEEAHDPELFGALQDRSPRTESYVKDFKPLNIGNIRLEKGRDELVLKATEINGNQLMDFRMLLLRRLE